MARSSHQTFFIDDAPDNITAARALGIDAHLHEEVTGSVRRIEDFIRNLPRQTLA